MALILPKFQAYTNCVSLLSAMADVLINVANGSARQMAGNIKSGLGNGLIATSYTSILLLQPLSFSANRLTG